uniref:CSON000099 protein n=1 Tax=Culicoides sonorensis TaxID=179676 RepID=A0A336LTG1_CULSO
MQKFLKELKKQFKIFLKNLEYLLRELRKLEIKNLKVYKSGIYTFLMMNIIIVSTLFLIINISQEIYGNPHHRREPVGFQGTRGRRSIIDDSKIIKDGLEDNYKINNSQNRDDNNDALQTNDVGSSYFVNSLTTESIINGNAQDDLITNSEPMAQLTIIKRAPAMGFHGVRGKKFDEFFSELDKRLPMGFQGVRGKKLLINYPHFWYYAPKRAPSGFMGMRGKKNYDYDDADLLAEYLSKRAPSGFMGMRGKRPEDYEQQYDNYITSNSNNNEDDARFYQALTLNRWYEDQLNGLDSFNDDSAFEKRAPAGFVGMRGRRFDELSTDFDKRAPKGFTAMRGKRAPVGFMGMRGKKDDTEVLENYDMKRAPVAGFLGMRGKKGPLGNSFFGTRGKKFPYEFRSKFIGVRGKKNFESNDISSEFGESSNMDKRKPNGFVGMRGKKDSASSSSVEE